jgi:hypothetical protein
MADAASIAARDITISPSAQNSQQPSAPPAPESIAPSDAALLALRLAPDIILGARLSGLKSGDILSGQLVLRPQDQTLLLVTERGIFAITPKEKLPTSGPATVQVSSIGRTVQAVIQNMAQPVPIALNFVALAPEKTAQPARPVMTADDAQVVAKQIGQNAPAIASTLRLLQEQPATLANAPVRPAAPPTAKAVTAAQTASPVTTLIEFADPENPAKPNLRGTLIAILDADSESMTHTGPLRQLLTHSRAVIVRALPNPHLAEILQAGKLPQHVMLPAGLLLPAKSQAIVLLEVLQTENSPQGEQIMTLIEKLPAETAAFVRERLPAAGPKLASQIALFTHISMQNPAPEIVPPGKDRLTILETFAALSRDNSASENITKITLPLRLAHEFVPLHITLYPPETPQQDLERRHQSAHASDHIFDISVTFPHIGPVFMTGLYHASHLSLAMATEHKLGPDMEAQLTSVFAKALSHDNWSGTLRFKSKAAA